MTDRPYSFYELTNSLCPECLKKVEAKIVFQKGKVYLQKFCLEHGIQKVLISTDQDYYLQCRNIIKPGQMPLKFNTKMERSCPFDCGLCPDHEQHSCLTLIEISDHCNLTCPICYADSSPQRQHRTLKEVEFMLDRIVENEGQPDVVQISGGEPTLHPDFFTILDMAKARPIKHLMINTNGILIANEPDFAKRLSEYMPAFEVYLQFDSFKSEVLSELRGAQLQKTRLKALEKLNEYNISTTLVVTVKKGANDDELGAIIDFALQQPCVRGVTFQPIQVAGRTEQFSHQLNRLNLSEIRQNILDQHPLFTANDIQPVPCHPDAIAMGYALKLGGQTIPLTQAIDPENKGNTIRYEEALKLFSTSHSPESAAQILCCLPEVEVPKNLSYNNLFRVIIMQFMDAHNFDVRSVKKSCVHIVHPDGRIIPFETYNLFYRPGIESELVTA